MEVFYSPVNGKTTKLENVNDEMFSRKLLGDGIALIPSEDEIMSPVDGVVSMVYETQHAIGISTNYDTEVLLHIGIDTVNLNGRPFQTKVKVGDQIKKGDLLTVVDWNLIKKEGLDVIVPVIVMNKKVVQRASEGTVQIGDSLFQIE